MPTPDPSTPKAQWREWARQTRADQPDASAALVTHLRAFLHSQGVRRVLAYRALPGEPDVSALQPDFELLTTRAHWRPTPRLTLHAWASATELSPFGALQPPADAPQLSLDTVEAALLPGLAYDRQGTRLGYGGGFYDRLLPDFAGLTVGVIWRALIVPELPREAHDCSVGWLASEAGVIPALPGGSP